MAWKPPTTQRGQPCKRCQKGTPCPSHRKRSAKSTKRRGAYKLDRPLLDELPEIVTQCRSHTEIIQVLGVNHTTFYRWLDRGEKDAEEGTVSLEREFYERVKLFKRVLAQRMLGASVRAAEGVWREETVKAKDGGEEVRVYQEAPDGRLALNIASRMDPREVPPERQRVEHGGSIGVAGVFRDKLADVFADDDEEGSR